MRCLFDNRQSIDANFNFKEIGGIVVESVHFFMLYILVYLLSLVKSNDCGEDGAEPDLETS